MHGQWMGETQGTNSGLAVVDLDDMGTHFEGHAYLFENNRSVPDTLVRIVTTDKADIQTVVSTTLRPIHPDHPHLLSIKELREDFEGVAFPQCAEIELQFVDGKLQGKWSTDIGTSGQAILHPSAATGPSPYTPRSDITTWPLFREYALSLPPRRYIFRGQDCSKRLRTSFHRTRRKDLVGYLNNDMPNAHHTLTARTKHLFNLSDASQNAAFLNLLQHHGYPTPLLDWSYSPFVAAFFAYRFRRHREDGDDKVRIFIFDKERWTTDLAQIQAIAFARPHFSIIEALTVENLRAMPQQSISSVTSLDDVEGYIKLLEEKSGKTYLEVIDLPFGERRAVMEQLSLMGITAGSLFPGLDGACEELRGRYFHPFD